MKYRYFKKLSDKELTIYRTNKGMTKGGWYIDEGVKFEKLDMYKLTQASIRCLLNESIYKEIKSEKDLFVELL